MAKKQSAKTAVTAETPPASVAAPVAAPIEEPTESVRHFLKPEDWLAGLAMGLLSGLAFFYYMAPEVTLQDSGELVTGAFTFGVPHPPGYPLWAFLGYVWSHFILPFGNPAWRIGMLSVVTGALTVAVMTVTMTRSVRLLLHSLPWSDSVSERLQHWLALTVACSTALLFGFNRGVWLWACVSEMRVLNVFSFVLLGCVLFAWIVQPYRRGFLYTALFLFGLSLANHQTIAVMAIPFGAGALAVGFEAFVEERRRSPGGGLMSTLMTCLASFWELAVAGLLSGMVGLLIFAWLRTPPAGAMSHDPAFMPGIAAGIAGTALLIVGHTTGWWSLKRALVCTGSFLAGVSFYLYMPLAAATNPPMNWGYAATKEGFLHAVTRGQYEKVETAQVFSEEFLLKIKVFTQGLTHQYSWPVVLLGLVSLVAMALCWRGMKPRGRAWMVFVWAAFGATSLGLLTIINPKLDKQEQEITIKFFAPAHGFYAMLIGYGCAVLLSLLAWRGRPKELSTIAAAALGVALLALPSVTYTRNWELCNLRGHDFGYLFGYLMFEPGGGYPSMEKDAVLYGGTDPGRFVPTYMIFCESRVAPKDRFRNENPTNRAFDRSDVYIITQNALADNTYMSYIRDHYDFTRPDADHPETIAPYADWRRFIFELGWKGLHRDHTYPAVPIRIPSPDDNNKAFQQYVQDVQSGRMPASAEISIENGRVSVQGVQGVMTINGILAQWIFDWNKAKHAFYVEESYVIPWMYPYLRPAGIIMKLEKDPLPSPQEDPKLWQEIKTRDRAYWDTLSSNFLARADFRRNSDAKKSFSKLRSAIAGLYAARGEVPEAEYAFKQSLALCPDSPEANFRLADLYMRLRRYTEARALIETYYKVDIYNSNAKNFLENIRGVEGQDLRRQALEAQMQGGQGKVDVNSALELAAIYQRLGMDQQFLSLTRSVLDSTNMPPGVYLNVAQIYAAGKRWDLFGGALRRYLQFDSRNFRIWIDVAYSEMAQNHPLQMFDALKRAVETGGEGARAALRQDTRFAPLQQNPDFRAIVPPPRDLPLLESGL